MNVIHQTVTALQQTSPAQSEFYQAVEDVLESVEPLLHNEPKYVEQAIIERLPVCRGGS